MCCKIPKSVVSTSVNIVLQSGVLHDVLLPAVTLMSIDYHGQFATSFRRLSNFTAQCAQSAVQYTSFQHSSWTLVLQDKSFRA